LLSHVRGDTEKYLNDFETLSRYIVNGITTNEDLAHRPHGKSVHIQEVGTDRRGGGGKRGAGGGRDGGYTPPSAADIAAVKDGIRNKWFTGGTTRTFIPSKIYGSMTSAEKGAVYQLRLEQKGNDPDGAHKRKIAALEAENKSLRSRVSEDDASDLTDGTAAKKSNSGHPALGRQPGAPRGGQS
jgi:hypothetical protein